MTWIQLLSEHRGVSSADKLSWLQQLQPGQQLSGRVMSQPRAGLVEVAIAGHRVSAEVSRTLDVGTTLALKVLSTSPQVRLEVASPTPRSSPAGSPQVAPSLSGVVDQPLAALSKVLRSIVAAQGDPRGASSAASELFRSLPALQQLLNPSGLQVAARLSGTWLEAQLAQGAGARDGSQSADMKAMLARLLLELRAAPAGERAASLPAIVDVERALLEINANQLKSMPADSGQVQSWQLSIPFLLRGEAHAMHWTVTREDSGDGAQGSAAEAVGWRVKIQVNEPVLGLLELDIGLGAEGVSLCIRGDPVNALEPLAAARQQLSGRLGRAGLELAGFELASFEQTGSGLNSAAGGITSNV